jgi:hypothetical protein
MKDEKEKSIARNLDEEIKSEGKIVAFIIDEKRSTGNVDVVYKVGIVDQIPENVTPLIKFDDSSPKKLVESWEKIRTELRRLSYAVQSAQTVADSQAFSTKIKILSDTMLDVKWKVSCKIGNVKQNRDFPASNVFTEPKSVEMKIYTFEPIGGNVDIMNEAVRTFCYSQETAVKNLQDEWETRIQWYQRDSIGIPGIHDFSLDGDGNLKSFTVLGNQYAAFLDKFDVTEFDVDEDIIELSNKIKDLQELLDAAQKKKDELTGDA